MKKPKQATRPITPEELATRQPRFSTPAELGRWIDTLNPDIGDMIRTAGGVDPDGPLRKWTEQARDCARDLLVLTPTLPKLPAETRRPRADLLAIREWCVEAHEKRCRPPLVGNALAVYELLNSLPEYRCLTGPEICDALAKLDEPIDTDDSTLRKHVFPVLKAHYGLQNFPNRGYCLRR